MHTHRIRILLLLAAVLAGTTSVLLAPVASASNPENQGYTCLFGYNPQSAVNACYVPLPTVTPGQTTFPTPCIVGNFPCSADPSTTLPVVVNGLGPYVNDPTDDCFYVINLVVAYAMTSSPCIPPSSPGLVYVCDGLVAVPSVLDKCS